MAGKETLAEKLEKLGRELEAESRLRGEEFVKSRLRWEDWGRLLPRLTAFAKEEIRRRRWRGKRSGVLPEGYDANSIAAEVAAAALAGKARLVRGWTFERLEAELQRLVSQEVRRLHKLKETRVMRSEWEVRSGDAENEPRSVLARLGAAEASVVEGEPAEGRSRELELAEQWIAERLGGEDRLVRELFACLCDGVVRRRDLASRLGISVQEVTNCRKRLNRKLEELVKAKAGIPRWVVEELRGRS